MPLYDYRCLAHGPFQALHKPEETAACPHGCTVVEKLFSPPSGYVSSKTKQTDARLKRLMHQFGMTDFDNRGGQSATEGEMRTRKRSPLDAHWGQMPAGNVFVEGRGEEKRDGASGGATAAIEQVGATLGGGDADLVDIRQLTANVPRPATHVVGSAGSAADLQKFL